jgi:hypothetical protein
LKPQNCHRQRKTLLSSITLSGLDRANQEPAWSFGNDHTRPALRTGSHWQRTKPKACSPAVCIECRHRIEDSWQLPCRDTGHVKKSWAHACTTHTTYPSLAVQVRRRLRPKR